MRIKTAPSPSLPFTILSPPLSSHTPSARSSTPCSHEESEGKGLKVTSSSSNVKVDLLPKPTFSFTRSSIEGKSYAAIASRGKTAITTTGKTEVIDPDLNDRNSLNLTLAPPNISITDLKPTSGVSTPPPSPPSPQSPTPLIMPLLRLIVKNNPTGVPGFQVTTATPFVLSQTFPTTSPYSVIPSQTSPASPQDLSNTLNTRHIRVQDDLHDLVLSSWKKSALDQEDAEFGVGNRRVRLKIYEVNEWLISRGWGLLGSHVESYEGGFICDVHTYLLAPSTTLTKRGGRRGKKGGKVMGTKASEKALVVRSKGVRTVREEDEECERE